MTTPRRSSPPSGESPAKPTEPTRLVDKAQYGLAAFLVLAGGYVLLDAVGLDKGFADQPVQPYTLPYVVGGALVLLGVLLAIATARGDRPEAEEGEDIDLTQGTDVRTVGLLALVLVANIALIDLLGWAITGALLFAGAAVVLGSRNWVRDLAVGVALSVGSWYGFYVGLGIPIPAGILDGVL
ncbi:tripartite tricarboxylate transporter TctB family protein [Nocardioides sp. R1-1]|uniref:tripartite tricarboxylate transporter TctB family protein n=1 Tax=Nocardioides sp. R1-1 TaxID=3383502 RepID=UPI0038D025AF